MIRIRRVYEAPSDDDGMRVLVDRLWPRGLSKHDARIDAWMKELSPGTELRKWFSHDPAKWNEFRKRYFADLRGHEGALAAIIDAARSGTVTLLYASKEIRLNNAAALKEYLERIAAVGRKAA